MASADYTNYVVFIWLLGCDQLHNFICYLQKQVRTLRAQLGQLQHAAGVSPVNPAFGLVRQLAVRLPNAFDPYALIGALKILTMWLRPLQRCTSRLCIWHCLILLYVCSLYLVPVAHMRKFVYPNQHPEDGILNSRRFGHFARDCTRIYFALISNFS